MRECLRKLKSVPGANYCALMAIPITVGVFAACNLPAITTMIERSGLWMPVNLEDTAKGVAIYDRFDRYVCTVYDGKDKEPVSLNKVSPNMTHAIIAAEDHNFYKHAGLDGSAIARAIVHNIKAGRVIEGASTITQQLARTLYLDPNDRSLKRKVWEAYIALQIEARYQKEKILEHYLNEVYFGRGAYGIERAAANYFNKHASQLTVAESAFLAGTVRAPSTYSEKQSEATAMATRDDVLDQMVAEKFITTDEAQRAKSTRLVFKGGSHRLRYPHYVGHVLSLLNKEMGRDLWTSGCKVYTNLDPALQRKAEYTLTHGLKKAPAGINQGALVSKKLSDGAILAMVGGVGSYDKNQWNRAIYPHTAGSTFKPFVYLSGILSGVLNQDSLVADTPLVVKTPNYKDYRPENFDGSFNGWMTVRDALAQSRNVCAVRVALSTGLDRVIATARSAGLGAEIAPYPSSALGSCAVSPLHMTEAYGTVARAGVRVEPQFLRKITGPKGQTLRTFMPAPSRTFPEEETARLIEALKDVVDHGTGVRARLPGISVAGKTGTADKGKDIWFVGFTPEYVTTVWAGNDQNKPVRGARVTGGHIMAGIWQQFMTGLYSTYKPNRHLAFAQPQQSLLRSIPLYADEALLSFSGVSSTGALLKLNYDVKPVGQVWNLKLDDQVSPDGIAGAVAVQKVAAEKRRQIAELKNQQEYRSAMEHGLDSAALPTSLPGALTRTTAAAARGQMEAPAWSPAGSVQAPQVVPSPESGEQSDTLSAAQVRRDSTNPLPALADHQGEPLHTSLVESDSSAQVRDPSADILKKDKHQKNKDEDKESEEEEESDEVAMSLGSKAGNASVSRVQHSRYLHAPRQQSPYVREYGEPSAGPVALPDDAANASPTGHAPDPDHT